jgi:glycosidase
VNSKTRRTRTHREFHVNRASRDTYGIDRSLYQLSGDVVIPDMQTTRKLAHRMNQTRDLIRNPASAVRAGDIHAMGMIDELMHHIVDLYLDQEGEGLFGECLHSLTAKLGAARVDRIITRFAELFPPTAVYAQEMTLEQFMESQVDGRSGRETMLEELVMLWLENQNSAFSPFRELFDDSELRGSEGYDELISEVGDFFSKRPGFGPDDEPLLEMLQKPAKLFPNSLEKQLAFVRERWGTVLGDFLLRLLRSLDLLREESKSGLSAGGPGPSRVLHYGAGTSTGDDDPERFSPDKEWMPRTVVIAKSTLVWLDQLSKQYDRPVTRLDQIPDEELDRLAGWGINGLWLIGLWERSTASKRIKNIMGNPDAEASAYALYDYEIARELGGWDAVDDLRNRCRQRGIRLASDMVPNHTGIDGRWVVEHPDWFIQVGDPPFPGYTFESENLSQVDGIGIHLEDHYYSKSDAAVVFKRIDHASGQTRYIYHGNDGTSMPWNDTAQLDFLNPEVREAVIQTILHVARNFSIIRFDAAMTLARKHIQRLWYPLPGSGGDIASRAEHGLTQEAFDTAIPQEFWREVVDRVAAEAPDTLLLAEAFWMMEGYFVRTLGMHRVYNSAFMNMLKNEENAKYRQTIKNTVEFDKDILKRFVNFMNNPDEETAVAQFGTGDKYIGVCTLMVTMPGLPMFGHGQVEGFTEKYGMEYRRAYLDEQPNRELIARHEREVFPLMRRRHLFSGVEHFLLYDVYGENGGVNENVFAYSNRVGTDRVLVLYNNSFERAWGWIKASCPFTEKGDGGRQQHRTELSEGLSLNSDYNYFTIFRDQRSGLWFIRRSSDIVHSGLFVDLQGYQCHVFLDFYEVHDNTNGYYAQLYDELGGAGVPDVERAIRDVARKPLHDLYAGVANSQSFHQLGLAVTGSQSLSEEECGNLQEAYHRFVDLAGRFAEPDYTPDGLTQSLCSLIHAAERVPFLNLEQTGKAAPAFRAAVNGYTSGLKARADRVDLLVTWLLLRPLALVYDYPVGVCEEFGLIQRSARAFTGPMHDHEWKDLTKVLLTHGEWWRELDLDSSGAPVPDAGALLKRLVTDATTTGYLGLNEFQGTVYFNKERLEELCWWLEATGLIQVEQKNGPQKLDEVIAVHRVFENITRAIGESDYRIAALLDSLEGKRGNATSGTKKAGAGRKKGPAES